MRVLLILLLATCGAAFADDVMLTMADPSTVTCTNPATPSLTDGAGGGLDEGQIGDADCLRLGNHEVGKRYYGANDDVTIYFRATGPLQVKLGLLLSEWGSKRAELLLNGQVVREFSAHAKPDRPATETCEITGTGALQALMIRPATGVGNYVHVDALAISGDGKVEVLDADGRPVLVASAALPLAAAQAAAAAMTPQGNLARVGDKMTYQVTEEFASCIDGSQTYAAQAALDGNPESDYWAGGTAPPHALVLTWKEPVTFNHHRIIWLGKNRALTYGLEYWDGERWRLLYEEPRNLQPEPIYRFAPVTTTSVRFTATSLVGEQRMLMRAFELYNLPEGTDGK